MLRHPSVILEINIPMRPPPHPQIHLYQRLPSLGPLPPRLLHKRHHHIRPVQQCPTRPHLVIPGPAFDHPVRVGTRLAEHVDHEGRARSRLAVEGPNSRWDVDASADGEEGGTFVVCFAGVGEFGSGGLVADVGGANENNVQWGACIKRVLIPTCVI
jgi:hypothetical protein